MPEGMFDRPKVLKLESIDLSHNKFSKVPVDVLQAQVRTGDSSLGGMYI